MVLASIVACSLCCFTHFVFINVYWIIGLLKYPQPFLLDVTYYNILL